MANIDIKSILLGLIVVVLISTIYAIVIGDFTSHYNMQNNATETLGLLNELATSDINQTVNQYSDILFADSTEDPTFGDFISFMWKGTWSVFRQTIQLPAKVVSIISHSLDAVGMNSTSNVSNIRNAILIALASILTVIIVFAVIEKIRGSNT